MFMSHDARRERWHLIHIYLHIRISDHRFGCDLSEDEVVAMKDYTNINHLATQWNLQKVNILAQHVR